MVIKVQGLLDFQPQDVTKKHKSQSSWKRVAIIKTNCDISSYYAWFLKKRFNLELNRTLRGTHISFINDKMDFQVFQDATKHFHGKPITFYHELEPQSNGKHWWLNVYSPEAESIREVCGLTRHPYFGFHLTLGLANEKNIAHSEYILQQCKMFNLVDSPIDLELHEIK